jgi:hypothetical protein
MKRKHSSPHESLNVILSAYSGVKHQIKLFMLTKDKSGFQQAMQDCLIAWLAHLRSCWPRLIMKCMHTIKLFTVWLQFPEQWEVLHCSLVAKHNPPAPALFHIHKSALHTLASLAPGASTSTRRWGLIRRRGVKNDPHPWICRKHQIFLRKSGQLTHNEQVWVSALSGRADTDGLESAMGGSFIAAYIFHLGRPQWQTGP